MSFIYLFIFSSICDIFVIQIYILIKNSQYDYGPNIQIRNYFNNNFIFSSLHRSLFELTVKVVDESLSPVSNSEVKISITDIDNGQLVPGSILSDEGVTDSEGKISFSFENKAFITARACSETL